MHPMRYRAYRGYRRGGFFWPILMVGLFFLVFGKLLFPLLLLLFFVAPFFFWRRGAGHWQDWNDKPKRKHDDEPRYRQTADGAWVEIV